MACIRLHHLGRGIATSVIRLHIPFFISRRMNMSKELELLNHLLDTYIDDQNYDYTAYIELEKSLKALEIIKEKWVNVQKFMFCAIYNGAPLTWKKYDSSITWKQYSNKKLTKQEFDLLKEVLL